MKRESWLPAAPASAPEARAIVRAAASELRLDRSTTWDLMLATTEAVANAVEHGKPCDPRGIYLGLETRDGTLGIEVRDCGCFPPEPRTRKPDSRAAGDADHRQDHGQARGRPEQEHHAGALREAAATA